MIEFLLKYFLLLLLLLFRNDNVISFVISFCMFNYKYRFSFVGFRRYVKEIYYYCWLNCKNCKELGFWVLSIGLY